MSKDKILTSKVFPDGTVYQINVTQSKAEKLNGVTGYNENASKGNGARK